ncbi:MAG: hypothetical protein NXI24_21290 [bacterium]|nr:hypothetical protein [bacterium]
MNEMRLVLVAMLGLTCAGNCSLTKPESETAAALPVRLCQIVVAPLQYAPAWIDNGRILPRLTGRFGQPLRTHREDKPNFYRPEETDQHYTYDFPNISFETVYVPHIQKEILAGVRYAENASPGLIPPGTLQKPQDLFASFGEPDAVKAGEYVYGADDCSGHGFSGVAARLYFSFQGEKMRLEIFYEFE